MRSARGSVVVPGVRIAMDSRGSSSSAVRKRASLLAIDATARAETETETESKVRPEEEEEEEPVSPTGWLFREPHFSCYIVSVFGLGAPVDLPAVRAGLRATLARHPRFCSVQTVNDVLLGVTSAALSRYYLRKIGEIGKKNIEVRSTLLVNLRQTPGLHTLASMMESGKDNGAKWGNRLGYMIIPFHIAEHDDVLEYVRKATKVARRKKSSMESVFTYWNAHMIMKIFGIKAHNYRRCCQILFNLVYIQAAASLCYGMMRNTTLTFSNMVRPTEQVVFYGHPIVYIAPSVYGHPHALTMHYRSYMNIIKLVLAVDEEQFPDAHELLDVVAESLRLIREAASGKLQDTSHAERCSPVARRQGDIS